MDLVRRPMLCLLGWSVALMAGALPVAAQESAAASAPATVAQAPPSATPTPVPKPRADKAQKRRPLVDFQITAQKSYGIGADQLVTPARPDDLQIFFTRSHE